VPDQLRCQGEVTEHWGPPAAPTPAQSPADPACSGRPDKTARTSG